MKLHKKSRWYSISVLLFIFLILPVIGQAQSDSGYVEANGINYYYEIHSDGQPLLLLHGGLKDAGWQRENMTQNRLAILPNLTHYEIFIAPKLAETTLPFLNGESGAPSWSEQVDAPRN